MYKGVRFLALADGQEVGRCECQIDLTHGGALPALAGWAELCELQVDAASRNQGIGSWLVARATGGGLAADGKLRPCRAGDRARQRGRLALL